MTVKTVEFVLVPDSCSARRLRRMIAHCAARLGLVVGTWAELLDLAAQSYGVGVTDDALWDERLQVAADVPEPFWAESMQVAPRQVLAHLDRTMRELLHATSDTDLGVVAAAAGRLRPRVAGNLADLYRLHRHMDYILPGDLAVLKQICSSDVSEACFAVKVYRHRRVPLLSRQQLMLIEKLDENCSAPFDRDIECLLAQVFDGHSNCPGALGHLHNNLFNAAAGQVALDETLQWLALRDYREEITSAVAMIRQMLADDPDLGCGDIAILTPDISAYTATLAGELENNAIPCSGLQVSVPVRDLGGELLRSFIAALQPPTAKMAYAALFSSPLMPWAPGVGNRWAQAIMDGYGLPQDNPLTAVLAVAPDNTGRLVESLQALVELVPVNDFTSRHRARLQQLVQEISHELPGDGAIDWPLLERLLPVQQLCDSSTSDYYQQAVAVFSAHQEPWRSCRVLLVLGFTAGCYPAVAPTGPVFSQDDIAAINTVIAGELVTSKQILQQRRELFRRQLQAATDAITFFVPQRNGAGEALTMCESQIFMAQLFSDIGDAKELLLHADNREQRNKIRHLVYEDKAEADTALHLPVAVDLELKRDLLALRRDQEGHQKPESPSGLETLLVSPLAWLLHRFHLEPQAWSVDSLDVLTRGSLAHRVFEHLFSPGQPVPKAQVIAERVPQLLREAAREIFPLLQRDEWRVERRNLQRELITAARRWGEILTAIDATIIGVEVPLSGYLDKVPVAGIADLLLRLPDGRLLVVDYKKSGSSARIKRMEKGYDSQANLYRVMITSGGTTDNDQLQQILRQARHISVMYYLLNDQVALSDSSGWSINDIAGWHEMGDAIADNAMELIAERLDQLRHGRVILNNTSDMDEFEKTTGIKPYALENSPLIKMFMKQGSG